MINDPYVDGVEFCNVFWHLIQVRCSCRYIPGDVSLERQSITKYVEFGPLIGAIFSLNVEFGPVYFPECRVIFYSVVEV